MTGDAIFIISFKPWTLKRLISGHSYERDMQNQNIHKVFSVWL